MNTKKIMEQKDFIKECLDKSELPFFVKDEVVRLSWVEDEINEIVVEEMFKYIDQHPEKPWDWDWISRNPNLTMKFVEDHQDKPWDWVGISWNPNLTMKFVEDHPNNPWNWDGISRYMFTSFKREYKSNLSKSMLL